MARTSIAPTNLLANNAVAPTSTAIDIVNGMTLSAAQAPHVIVLVTNTDVSAHNVSLRAGDPIQGLGTWPDLVVSVPASGSRYFGPFDSARYSQKDAAMYFDFTAGHTGTVTALLVPRGV